MSSSSALNVSVSTANVEPSSSPLVKVDSSVPPSAAGVSPSSAPFVKATSTQESISLQPKDQDSENKVALGMGEDEQKNEDYLAPFKGVPQASSPSGTSSLSSDSDAFELAVDSIHAGDTRGFLHFLQQDIIGELRRAGVGEGSLAWGVIAGVMGELSLDLANANSITDPQESTLARVIHLQNERLRVAQEEDEAMGIQAEMDLLQGIPEHANLVIMEELVEQLWADAIPAHNVE